MPKSTLKQADGCSFSRKFERRRAYQCSQKVSLGLAFFWGYPYHDATLIVRTLGALRGLFACAMY